MISLCEVFNHYKHHFQEPRVFFKPRLLIISRKILQIERKQKKRKKNQGKNVRSEYNIPSRHCNKRQYCPLAAYGISLCSALSRHPAKACPCPPPTHFPPLPPNRGQAHQPAVHYIVIHVAPWRLQAELLRTAVNLDASNCPQATSRCS